MNTSWPGKAGRQSSLRLMAFSGKMPVLWIEGQQLSAWLPLKSMKYQRDGGEPGLSTLWFSCSALWCLPLKATYWKMVPLFHLLLHLWCFRPPLSPRRESLSICNLQKLTDKFPGTYENYSPFQTKMKKVREPTASE